VVACGAQTLKIECQTLPPFYQGEAAFIYESGSYYDDLLWAAAWLYHATSAQMVA
jgi:hypothetical protein